MTAEQEYSMKTAFRNLNSMKRSYSLATAERDKQAPSQNAVNMHELKMVQYMLQLELSLRAIQNELRKEDE